MPLEKAKLIVYSAPHNDAEDIEFMFNPEEVSFTRSVGWRSDRGNRGTTLLPKVNFAGLDPYEFTLQNLVFDTYEEKTSVMDDYIDNIKQGVTARANPEARPPIYVFTWGEDYFHCVITNLTYSFWKMAHLCELLSILPYEKLIRQSSLVAKVVVVHLVAKVAAEAVVVHLVEKVVV